MTRDLVFALILSLAVNAAQYNRAQRCLTPSQAIEHAAVAWRRAEQKPIVEVRHVFADLSDLPKLNAAMLQPLPTRGVK